MLLLQLLLQLLLHCSACARVRTRTRARCELLACLLPLSVCAHKSLEQTVSRSVDILSWPLNMLNTARARVIRTVIHLSNAPPTTSVLTDGFDAYFLLFALLYQQARPPLWRVRSLHLRRSVQQPGLYYRRQQRPCEHGCTNEHCADGTVHQQLTNWIAHDPDWRVR
jgi:hypothetical protein